jgi:antitoxin component YwqK of YwqJK toxin-antitoxin module
MSEEINLKNTTEKDRKNTHNSSKKSSSKKILLLLFLVLIGVGVWYGYQQFGKSTTQREVLSVVPEKAVYIFKTNELTKAWKEVDNTNIWKHLIKTKGFEYLQDISKMLNRTLIDNSATAYLFKNRPTLMSAHITGKNTYDFLYVIDLKNSKHIKAVFDYVLKLDKAHKITKLNYKETKIFKLIDKKNQQNVLYIASIDNLLLSSMSFSLLKQSIDEKDKTHWLNRSDFVRIDQEINDEIIQFYFNYKKLPEYASIYLQDAAKDSKDIAEQLRLSGFDISHDDERIIMTGLTVTDSLPSYMNALLDVKPGKIKAYNVISNQAALYISLGFKNFNIFRQSLLDQYTQKDKKKRAEYRKQLKKLESFFKFSLQKDLYDWIGQEVAIVKLRSYQKRKAEKMVMLIEAEDIDDAKEGLTHIVEQIRKRSPFKFKTYKYKNFDINYLHQKKFFKAILGNLFAKIDKPYFTYIENYVVFSNSEQDLKDFVNDYIMGKTLSHNQDFMDFKDDLSPKANINVYIQMPKLYAIMQQNATVKGKQTLLEKENLLLSFSRIGYQMIAKDDVFKTLLVIDHDEKAKEKEKSDEIAHQVDKSIHNRYFEDLQFKVFFPDSVQVPNGIFRQFWNDGKTIKIEGKVTNNLPVDIWRTYYKSGNLESVVHYKDGDVDGEIFFYFDNANEIKKVETSYENNLLEGKYTEYWKNGAQKSQLEYEHGKLHGKAKYFFSSGKIKIEGKYKKGERKGKWYFYDQNGKVINKKRYSGFLF